METNAATHQRKAIRQNAEAIIALSSGPWAEGKNLPPDLSEPMIVRSEHYRKHAQAILDVLAGIGKPPSAGGNLNNQGVPL